MWSKLYLMYASLLKGNQKRRFIIGGLIVLTGLYLVFFQNCVKSSLALKVVNSELSQWPSAFPWPAKSPNTDVQFNCDFIASEGSIVSKCGSLYGNQKIIGYPTAFSTFVGRFVDSTNTRDCQQPWRTARAKKIIALPEKDRIYMIIGEEFESFKLSSFLNKVQDPGNWVSGPQARVGVISTCLGRSIFPDLFLRGDGYLYAESSWITYVSDGQPRLFDFDIDDRGYIYLDYSVYGWGILKDDGLKDGGPYASVSSVIQCSPYINSIDPDHCPLGQPLMGVVRGSNGNYYLIGSQGQAVFDVTDPAHPYLVRNGGSSFSAIGTIQRNAIGDRVAAVYQVAGSDLAIGIFAPDILVSGGLPLVSFPGSLAGATGNANAGWYDHLATDGINFFAVSMSATGNNKVWVISPFGSTYTIKAAATFDSFGFTTIPSGTSVHYGAGYLAVGASENGDWNLFKVTSNLEVQKVDLNNYFGFPPAGYVSAPSYKNLVDAAPFSFEGRAYLVVSNYGLGDVYQMAPDGNLSTISENQSPGYVGCGGTGILNLQNSVSLNLSNQTLTGTFNGENCADHTLHSCSLTIPLTGTDLVTLQNISNKLKVCVDSCTGFVPVIADAPTDVVRVFSGEPSSTTPLVQANNEVYTRCGTPYLCGGGPELHTFIYNTINNNPSVDKLACPPGAWDSYNK